MSSDLRSIKSKNLTLLNRNNRVPMVAAEKAKYWPSAESAAATTWRLPGTLTVKSSVGFSTLPILLLLERLASCHNCTASCSCAASRRACGAKLQMFRWIRDQTQKRQITRGGNKLAPHSDDHLFTFCPLHLSRPNLRKSQVAVG